MRPKSAQKSIYTTIFTHNIYQVHHHHLKIMPFLVYILQFSYTIYPVHEATPIYPDTVIQRMFPQNCAFSLAGSLVFGYN